MIPTVTIDDETKSYADLKAVGAWAYSEHPTTDLICVCWGIDRRPLQHWVPGMPVPDEIMEAAHNGYLFEAHNLSFEYSIHQNVLRKRYGWPAIREDRWRDTMAVACYYALPASLDRLAAALGFQGKDPEGAKLITRYSKLYLKTAKTDIPPEDLARWIAYCKRDVAIEQSISDYLGDLPDRELPVFQMDQEMNRLGIYLDLEGIECATKIVEQRSDTLTAEFHELVGCNPTQRDRVMAWFAEQGLKLDNLQAEYLEGLVADGELPQGPVRRALEIRLSINRASTKKLDAMARQRGSDGRARFQTRYHGASTGRNTGAGFQPLNLTRGFDKMDPEQLVRDIMYGDARWLDTVYGDAMVAISNASRYWLQARPGNEIVAGDFVSIEAVLLACLAGETWKIEAFRQGAKIYELMADKIYRLPPGTVTKDTHPTERLDGKIGELALGYQGALGAWLGFDNSGRHTDERILEICKAWRAEHPAIKRMWYCMEEAAIEAVHTGKLVELEHSPLAFEMVDEWLSMILPNGKRIWYFKPQLRTSMPNWHQPATKPDCASGDCDCRPRPQLTYMSQKYGQWRRVSTYGGKLTENATQAVSRELMVPAALRARQAGYPPILTVYDEVVCEVPKGYANKQEFGDILKECPGEWAREWPIGVDVWIGERYRK